MRIRRVPSVNRLKTTDLARTRMCDGRGQSNSGLRKSGSEIGERTYVVRTYGVEDTKE